MSVNRKLIPIALVGFVAGRLFDPVSHATHSAWVSIKAGQFVDGIVHFLTVPRFSIYDLLSGLLVLIMIYLFVWMAAYGPRP